MSDQGAPPVGLATIAREWGRIGVIGFGGPPTHIALLRALCIDQRGWLTPADFEDGIAATNLLPGPASTQLAIYCAWRLRGSWGALVGGVCFIVPGLVMILALSSVFLGADPPRWVLGAAAGAGAGVPAVAVHAASGLLPASWKRTHGFRPNQIRWVAYVAVAVLAAATLGPFLVLVLVLCGVVEIVAERPPRARRTRRSVGEGPPGRTALGLAPTVAATGVFAGGLGAVAWVALKVGALSYGGGFVIIPLMQHDAVDPYHWMTAPQFLNAVALGQITPGPVVLTVAAVGFAAGGLVAGVLAAVVAFLPSFVFVISGAPHFDRLRQSHVMQAFLTGAGAAAIGAILGAAIPLAMSLVAPWQVAVLVLAAIGLFTRRTGVVLTLFVAAGLGVAAALTGLVIAA